MADRAQVNRVDVDDFEYLEKIAEGTFGNVVSDREHRLPNTALLTFPPPRKYPVRLLNLKLLCFPCARKVPHKLPNIRPTRGS